MNRTRTSQEAILSIGKEIVHEAGIQGLNIRDVARKSGVSVGSIYNYFPTKSDLVVATIESIWKEIMYEYKICKSKKGIINNVQALFMNIQNGSQRYPSFFEVHSISLETIDKAKGQESMQKYFLHIKKGLLKALYEDDKVKGDSFSENFTKEDFIDFIFSNLITLLMKQANTCDFLLEVIKRTVY